MSLSKMVLKIFQELTSLKKKINTKERRLIKSVVVVGFAYIFSFNLHNKPAR